MTNTNEQLKAIHSKRNKDVVCYGNQLDSGDWILTVGGNYFQDLKLSLDSLIAPKFYRAEDILISDSMMLMIFSVCPKAKEENSVVMRESAVDTILLSVLTEIAEDTSYEGLEFISPFQLFSRIELCANRRRLESLFSI